MHFRLKKNRLVWWCPCRCYGLTNRIADPAARFLDRAPEADTCDGDGQDPGPESDGEGPELEGDGVSNDEEAPGSEGEVPDRDVNAFIEDYARDWCPIRYIMWMNKMLNLKMFQYGGNVNNMIREWFGQRWLEVPVNSFALPSGVSAPTRGNWCLEMDCWCKREVREDNSGVEGWLPDTMQGRYQKTGVFWHNEELNELATRYVRENRVIKGKPNLNLQSFTAWVNSVLLLLTLDFHEK